MKVSVDVTLPEFESLNLDALALAQSAYLAYGAVTDHKNYQGLPMPQWDDLTPKIKAAWVSATESTMRAAAAEVLARIVVKLR